MLVKAKWNVKDSTGWHPTGSVFMTEDDLGSAVEVLEGPKKREPMKQEEAVKAPEKAPETVPAEPEKEPARPKSTRRKVSK